MNQSTTVKNEILLGDEAVALGAIHAGITAAYSYPGTPASEIMEFLIRSSGKRGDYLASWSVNEKVAYEEALGVSFAGRRAAVSMKHVGLNVAADPFVNSAVTGTNGGLLVVVADDPGMHSSQNEQDSRYYAQFAHVPCFEPSDHQEAYDMARRAFETSEKLGVPVMMRLVTRLAHSRSGVETREADRPPELTYGTGEDWTLLPVNARRRFRILLEKQPRLVALSEESSFNHLTKRESKSRVGILASGIAYNYVMENLRDLEDPPSVLKICTYPLPRNLISRLVEHVETIVVVEDGYPFIERSLTGMFGLPGKEVKGRLTGDLPASGELSPETVRSTLGLAPKTVDRPLPRDLAARPPQLCQGCPHADTYNALQEALQDCPRSNVFSDIGCYTLGALPPYHAIETCVCMGASVSMAKGGADAGVHPAVAVIGDSTFGHSGLTPLLDAAVANTNMTVVILDNSIVAMTGGQSSASSGQRLLSMIEGVGVPPEHIRVIEPLRKHKEKNVQILKEEFDYQGLSVIVAVRECIQETRKRRKAK